MSKNYEDSRNDEYRLIIPKDETVVGFKIYKASSKL